MISRCDIFVAYKVIGTSFRDYVMHILESDYRWLGVEDTYSQTTS